MHIFMKSLKFLITCFICEMSSQRLRERHVPRLKPGPPVGKGSSTHLVATFAQPIFLLQYQGSSCSQNLALNSPKSHPGCSAACSGDGQESQRTELIPVERSPLGPAPSAF